MSAHVAPIPSTGHRASKPAAKRFEVGSRYAEGDPYAHYAVALVESGLRALVAAYTACGSRHVAQVCRMRAVGRPWPEIAAAVGSGMPLHEIEREEAFLRRDTTALLLDYLGLPDDAGERLITLARQRAQAALAENPTT